MYPYVFEISINTLSAYKIEAKEICSKDAKTCFKTGLTLPSKLNSLFSTFKSTFQAKSLYTNTFPNIFKKYCSDFLFNFEMYMHQLL